MRFIYTPQKLGREEDLSLEEEPNNVLLQWKVNLAFNTIWNIVLLTSFQGVPNATFRSYLFALRATFFSPVLLCTSVILEFLPGHT